MLGIQANSEIFFFKNIICLLIDNTLIMGETSATNQTTDQTINTSQYVRLFVLGNLVITSGLLLGYALPPVISRYIDMQIALTPGSQSYPMWKETPVPIYQKFYFFNVTNAQEIEQLGHKPQLEEIGPFTYRSEYSKQDIVANALDNTIDFRHMKRWYFEPEMSIADHRLQLVTLNAPLAITLTLIQSAPSAVRLLVTFSLDGLSEGFFTKRSVKQLLFDGYPDLLTTFGPLLNAEMLSQGGQFGYFSGKNNSEDGHYEVNTGADNVAKLNTINRFNGKTKIPFWNQNHGQCSSLEGATTGEMFPPLQENQTEIKLFQPDFCRVWRLNYDSNLEHPSGLRLKRFIATRDILRNSTDLPENSCYFTDKPRIHDRLAVSTNRIPNPTSPQQHQSAQTVSRQQNNQNNRLNRNRQHQHQQQQQQQHHNHQTAAAGQSNNHNRHHNRVRHEWPNGVFTLAPCKFNAPIYLSMPHFLDADPYFSKHVHGLEPDPNRHEFYLDLEPRTGSPVMLSARVQINVAISRPPGLIRFRNVPEIMFPVFWQELTVNVSGPVIDNLLLASRQAQEVTHRVSYSLLFLGVAILTTTLLFYINTRLNLKVINGK